MLVINTFYHIINNILWDNTLGQCALYSIFFQWFEDDPSPRGQQCFKRYFQLGYFTHAREIIGGVVGDTNKQAAVAAHSPPSVTKCPYFYSEFVNPPPT